MPGTDDKRVSAQAQPDAEKTALQPSEIRTMPSKFLENVKAHGGKKTFLWIALGVLLLLFIIGGVLLFLRQANAPVSTPNRNTNALSNAPLVTNANTNAANGNLNAASNANGAANTNAAANTNTATGTVVQQNATDADSGEVVGSATITIPEGALPTSVTSVGIVSLSSTIGAYANSKEYVAVGGVYILTPAKTQLSKKASVELAYTDSSLLQLGFSVKEDVLTVGYWNGTDWSPINSVADAKKNVVTTDISQFYADGMAIIAPKPSAANTNTGSIEETPIASSLDSDSDGLTNQEEILYGTNAGSPDTDLDSYRDGQEVLAHYNPNGKNRLVDAALAKTYENATYRYSILYPPSWTVGTLNADKLVLFTSITGEFVQVSIQDNPAGQSAREWYLALNPSVSQSALKDVAVGSLSGVIGPDNLNVYLADKKYIYQVTYNIGIKTEANYLTTFGMMYISFLANITVTAPSSNTNINANVNITVTNTNSTSNTNNTNAANENTNIAANTNSTNQP